VPVTWTRETEDKEGGDACGSVVLAFVASVVESVAVAAGEASSEDEVDVSVELAYVCA
jgi:hypothetical protein